MVSGDNKKKLKHKVMFYFIIINTEMESFLVFIDYFVKQYPNHANVPVYFEEAAQKVLL